MKNNTTKTKSILFTLVIASCCSYAYLNLVDVAPMLEEVPQETVETELEETKPEVSLPDVTLVKKILDISTQLLSTH